MIDLTKLHEHDKFLLFELMAVHALLSKRTDKEENWDELAHEACSMAEAMVVARADRQAYRDGGCGADGA